jgi:hypothetical protein
MEIVENQKGNDGAGSGVVGLSMEKNRWVREWSCRRILSTKETMGVGSRVLAGLSAVLPKCDEEEGCRRTCGGRTPG